jgi:large subunit ribosomal protein L29
MAKENLDKDFSTEDLKAELKDLESQYQKLKFDHAIRGLANPISLRDSRRDIARVNTELRKRVLEEASPEELENRSKLRARRRRMRRAK